jgi:hypothetical protein
MNQIELIRKLSCKSEILWYCGVWEISKWPHFCDYPPFKEDYALHFNKLEFPSCKNGLYQVWSKLVRCVILKDSFQYSHVKIVSPLVAPPDPWGIICTSLNLHDVRKLSCKFDLFWLSGSLGEKFSMTSPYFCTFVIIIPWTKTCFILFIQGWLYQVWLKLACWFRRFFFSI